MATVIVDSDIIIDFLAGAANAERFAGMLKTGRIGTTTINAFEILSGAKTKKVRTAIHALLKVMDLYGFDESASIAAVEVRHELASKGKPIGMADYMIAGICISQNLKLYTKNQKHFTNITQLTLV